MAPPAAARLLQSACALAALEWEPHVWKHPRRPGVSNTDSLRAWAAPQIGMLAGLVCCASVYTVSTVVVGRRRNELIVLRHEADLMLWRGSDAPAGPDRELVYKHAYTRKAVGCEVMPAGRRAGSVRRWRSADDARGAIECLLTGGDHAGLMVGLRARHPDRSIWAPADALRSAVARMSANPGWQPVDGLRRAGHP